MKTGFVHICFIIDESGSMSGSEGNVCGGFNKVIEEQKAVKEGSCAISVYRFESTVKKEFVGKNVKEIGKMIARPWRYINSLTNNSFETINDNDLTYTPGGGTAMNDGIGTAIDEIGEWLSNMSEDDRPEKNMIVIITDGEENSSHRYSLNKIKEMIKHQEDKYSWEFIYLGTDIRDTTQGNAYGFKNQGYTSKKNISAVYETISTINSNFRSSNADYATKCYAYSVATNDSLKAMTNEYSKEIGVDLNSKIDANSK